MPQYHELALPIQQQSYDNFAHCWANLTASIPEALLKANCFAAIHMCSQMKKEKSAVTS